MPPVRYGSSPVEPETKQDVNNVGKTITPSSSPAPKTTKPLPFHKLLTYADALDWLLMALGTFGSVVHGMALPVGYLLLGKALDAFGNNITDEDATVRALKKVVPFVWYMAIATLPAGMMGE